MLPYNATENTQLVFKQRFATYKYGFFILPYVMIITIIGLWFSYNMEYDLRILICLNKSEVTIEGISVCNDIENLMEHDMHCLPDSYINDVINMLP